jgi:hypothetical protein
MLPEHPAAAPRVRPTGVSILAVLAFIGAAFALLFAFGAVAFGTLIGSMFGREGAAMGGAIGLMFAFFGLIGAAISGATGYGLWNGKTWGWVLGIIWAALWALGGLSRLATRDFSVVPLALGGLILWYLFQPAVKGWFGRT